MHIQFGDRVQFLETEFTIRSNIALKSGVCMGISTPSKTGIEFIGNQNVDAILCVELDESEELIWASEDQLELTNKGAGTVLEIGNKKVIKSEDGSWKKEAYIKNNWITRWIKSFFRPK